VYYDSIIGVSFKFDPFTLEATILSEESMQVNTSDLRDSLIPSMDKYIADSYRKGKALYAVT